jgi:hypothetical protein
MRTLLIREHSIFYGLLPVSVNQDQVVRTLPANCCVMKTCDVAAHTRIFTELSAGLTKKAHGDR